MRAYLFEQRYDQAASTLIAGGNYKSQVRASNMIDADMQSVSYAKGYSLLVVGRGDDDYERCIIGFYDPKLNTLFSLVDYSALPESLRGYSQTQPQMSSDGKTVMYVAEIARSMSSDGLISQEQTTADWSRFLISYSLATKKAQILLRAPQILDFALSTDGKFCIFRQSMPKTQDQEQLRFQIMRLDLATGQVRALTQPQNETDSQPVISPDGRFIAWLRHNYGERSPERRNKLALMRYDGSQQRPIRFNSAPQKISWIRSLADWSRYANAPFSLKLTNKLIR